jgi:hypothetical protein
MALCDVLELMPKDQPERPQLVAILNRVMESLLKVQDKKTHLWYQVPDRGGEEGNYLDIGENPFVQESSTPATVQTLRVGILNALNNISYTPFTCETVFGIHYDLGDIIRFEGGHAGEDGASCCLMAFNWTLNGTYQMQGFGSDPGVPMIKTKTQKSTKAANQNAVTAMNNSGGDAGMQYSVRISENMQMVDYTVVS